MALVGEALFWIACPEAQCLKSQLPLARTKYEKHLTQLVTSHRVVENLHSIYKSCDNSLSIDQQNK